MWDAWRDKRMDDVVATMQPDVVWRPITRPALSQYHGRDGILEMRTDIERLRGTMHIEIDAVRSDSYGIVRSTGFIRFVGDEQLTPFEVRFTFRDGLISQAETTYGRE